jgi:hypothetical protein
MKSEPMIPEKRWKDLASRIDALITSFQLATIFQLAPFESVNGKKRQVLIQLREYMKELEQKEKRPATSDASACAGCETTEGDCPSCRTKPAVTKQVSNACNNCEPGEYCETQCWCKKCPERLKCPGQEDCLYDDDHEQIRGVRK